MKSFKSLTFAVLQTIDSQSVHGGSKVFETFKGLKLVVSVQRFIVCHIIFLISFLQRPVYIADCVGC